ncbi:hypothetical protein JOF29_001111 [Kribbella aluminosa]|uniref:DUF1707 domain-containing protein n=1 Tax=Kribbella aluminosa TaxID=416017 RepID=A0ABS4UEI9_9ACTN|nr:DUF1707 domain-containing protein [Kribbella aluminosa]MBP2350028.1 hypothetical protein [Kribbella aluminosa]
MSSADRDRRRRGGPAGRRRRDWQGYGPSEGWNGWFDDPSGRSREHNWGGDWHARGWAGDWRATAWSEPTDGDPRNNTLNNQQSNSSANDGLWDRPDPRANDGLWDGPDPRANDVPRDGRDSRANDVPRKRVRIGDAERDQAVAMLSEHFVAGRLTQAEFEERSEQATKARYADEFGPLFDELPRTGELQPVKAGPPNLRRRPGPPPAFLMIAPFLMIGLVISSVALTAPWLLWGVFWIVMLSGISRGRWQQHYRR